MIRPVRPDGTIETGGVFIPIVRRRVIDRIASAAMQRVVLVIAPAGYGKSVALAQFLDTLAEPYLRYDVLPDNAGLLGFLRGFADAVAEVAPDARGTLAGAYEQNAGTPSPGTDLALWMHSHLRTYRGVIAIDDLQVAQSDREVTRFLTSLIERTKGRVQWVIASRATTGLPIGTWLAYGESDLAIDEHDLKFSVEEAKEAARAFRLGVRDEELFELLHLTDGWATAMTFALRSSTRSVDLRSISTMTREMVYRYLAEQVYQTLSDEERRFIETAALLPEINLDVMVAAGFDRASALLTDLRARVAFIHEDEAGRYRLHDLFRDFVLHEFELRGRDVALATNAKLGSLLEKLDLHVEALRLYVQGRREEDVLRILAAHGSTLIAKGFADEVDFALGSNLGAGFAREPLVTGLRGLVEMSRANFADADQLLSRAVEAISDARVRSELVLRLATLRANRGEDPTILLERVIDDGGAEPAIALESQALLAFSFARAGRANDARSLAEEIIQRAPQAAGEEQQARILLRIGNLYYLLENAELVKRYLDRAAELATRNALWSVASKAYRTLSNAAILLEGDSALSLMFAQKAVVAASRAGDSSDLLDALLSILGLETRRGNAERAIQIEKQIAELRANDSSRISYLVSSQAHRRAWAGDFAEAARLFGGILDRQAHLPDRVLVRACHALCLALAGSSRPAGDAVATVLDALDAGDGNAKRGSTLYEFAVALAVLAEIVSGRLTSAQRILKRPARDTGEAALAMRSAAEIVLRGARSPSFAPALSDETAALRDRGFGGYARYVEIVAGVVERGHANEEPVSLTPSELRILRYLASGLAPKDIAVEMSRSVYTIQTHIQNLNEKLGSHGRAEAITAARRLGLLEGAP